MKGKTAGITGILFLLSGALLIGARQAAGFADWYAGQVFPVWSGLLSRIFGLFPFSVAEMALYLLIAAGVCAAGYAAVRIGVRKGGAGFLIAWMKWLLFAVSMVCLLFALGSGINYQRTSFAEQTGLDAAGYTISELQEVCVRLTEEVNALTGQVTRDEEGIMQLSAKATGSKAAEIMEALGEYYPALAGEYPAPKPVALSAILSYLNLTGIYSPFTMEANYNREMTPYNIPFTMCHELSHLRGFMQEDEANFIAFLACVSAKDADFQYSGYLLGWIYCMNALYRSDADSWQEVRGTLAAEAGVDLAENNRFWDSHEGTLSEVSDSVNDGYLKANGQSDGVLSYDRVTDLIVAYYRQE